jgi:hypothetical protein
MYIIFTMRKISQKRGSDRKKRGLKEFLYNFLAYSVIVAGFFVYSWSLSKIVNIVLRGNE